MSAGSGGDGKDYTRYSGNVGFSTSFNGNQEGIDFQCSPTCEHMWVSHNTEMIASASRSVIRYRAVPTEDISFNLFRSTNTNQFASSGTPDADLLAMDWNWYIGPPTIITDGQTLAQRQANTVFDQNSVHDASVAGLDIPDRFVYEDPRLWMASTAFLALLTPDTGESMCDGVNTPGAFTCAAPGAAGTHIGLVIEPFPVPAPVEIGNNGCGWDGGDFAAMVELVLEELGVSGQCMAEWGFTP